MQAKKFKFRLRQLMKSPYVIGGLLTGAVALIAGYFVCRRSANPQMLYPRTTIRGSLTVDAAAVPEQNPRAISSVIPPSVDIVQKAGPARPLGSYLSQQWQMIKAAIKAWVDDYAPSMGAALSYYTIFSLAPLLIIVIAVAGLVFGKEAAQGEIVAQLHGIMGTEGAVAVEGMLKAAREPTKG